jgi:AcrR family transcriptional regulator
VRRDAVENRRKVLLAAEDVFTAKGVDAAVPEIAERAGVGKGTVYRSFPTKEHLIAAVAVGRLTAWAEDARAAASSPDPTDALTALLVSSARRQAGDHLLTDALAAAGHIPELAAARTEAAAALDALVDAAREAGGLRPEADGETVRTLYRGISRALQERGEQDPAQWAKYAALVVDAVRAG